MNKKVLIIISVLIVVVVIVLSIKNNIEKNRIPTYKSDIVCTKTNVEKLDEDEYVSKSIIYIYEDKDNVSKTIHQSIMGLNYDTGVLESIINLYRAIEGIDASLNVYGDSMIFEVTYDFDKINFESVQEKFESILSEDAILNTKELPIKVDDYLETLNDEYKCEVK